MMASSGGFDQVCYDLVFNGANIHQMAVVSQPFLFLFLVTFLYTQLRLAWLYSIDASCWKRTCRHRPTPH